MTTKAKVRAQRRAVQGGRPREVRRAAAGRRGRKSAPVRRRMTWVAVVAVVAVAVIGGIAIQAGRSKPSSSATPQHPLGPGGSEVMGLASAPVLVEEYGDFQCPSCRSWDQRVYPTVQKLARDGQIRFAFYPYSFIGPESFRAAGAAYCAGDQGAYWEFRKWLYDNQRPENSGALTANALTAAGRAVGITSPAFEQCVRDERYLGQVRRVGDGAVRRGVTGTPTIFVNGVRVQGGGLDDFVAAVTKAGAKV